MSNIKFWELQKEASLTNSQCAKYLDTDIRTIGRWRVDKPKAPKAVILALQYHIAQASVKAVSAARDEHD